MRKQKQKDVVTQKEPTNNKYNSKQTFKKNEHSKKRKRSGDKAQGREVQKTETKPANYKEYKTLHKTRKSYAES
jgi:hypothetical protein